MAFTYFAVFHDPRSHRHLAGDDQARVVRVLRTIPALTRALIYTPAVTTDPYLDDGAPPQLAIQLYFDRLDDLEAALARDGPLHALVPATPSLGAIVVTQQAMAVRSYPVPAPVESEPTSSPVESALTRASPCTYLVSYPGPADDLNAWLDYYIAGHPRLMAKFPGIREIEIATRIDWVGHLPWSRADAMLRNKVMFDSPQALTAALNSPVRHELREDFKHFPRFDGGNTHYPMVTRSVSP